MMDDQMQAVPQVPSDNQTGVEVIPPTQVLSVDQTATPPAPPASSSIGDFQSDAQHYDEEIKSDKIETKRKTFFLDLKANNMGRYVKISERSSGKRSTIIIPEENVTEFVDKLHGLSS